jgi:transaldolase
MIATSFLIIVLVSLSAEAFSPLHRGESRLFLDTADTNEWDKLLSTGIFHGVTTNPTLLERAGEECTIDNLHQMARKALQVTDEFMCQAWGSNTSSMYECGMALSAPSRDRIVIKVPVTRNGVEAASRLIQAGCRVCLTACYNHQQALIASSVGAEYLGNKFSINIVISSAYCGNSLF